MNEPQDPPRPARGSGGPVRPRVVRTGDGDAPAPVRRSASAPRRRRHKRAQLDAGAVISQTFSLFGRRILPFLLVGLIAFLPSLAFEYVTLKPLFDNLEKLSLAPEMLLSVLDLADYQRSKVLELLGSLILITCLLFLQGAVIYIVVEDLRGGRPSVARGLSISGSRLISMLGIALMISLLLYALLLVVLTVIFMFIGTATQSPAAVIVGTILGLLVVISMILTRFCVSIPVAIIERLPALRAMARSDKLTAGVRWIILGTGIVVYVVPLVIAQLAVHSWMDLENWKRAIGVAYAAQVVGGILLAVFCAVIYHDARVSSEGIEASDLARVFD